MRQDSPTLPPTPVCRSRASRQRTLADHRSTSCLSTFGRSSALPSTIRRRTPAPDRCCFVVPGKVTYGLSRDAINAPFDRRRGANLTSVEDAGGLTDLDQMTVGVSDVRPDLSPMILRLREELGTLRRPLLVGLRDVRNADVEERTRAIGIRGCRECDRRLVVRRPAAYVQNQPRVRDLHDDRISLPDNLPVEQRLIKLTGPILVGNNQKVREDETFRRRRKIACVHLHISFRHHCCFFPIKQAELIPGSSAHDPHQLRKAHFPLPAFLANFVTGRCCSSSSMKTSTRSS